MAFSPGDYTVAWICALPLEMAAAKIMLDEVHDQIIQPSTDHNSYTLGTIYGHKTVIACLPSSNYGTTSAATVLAHMLATFKSLRFGLMVGVGGGVPGGTADIRLGDVVVSMPAGLSSGVIQYDYGKEVQDGQFQVTGYLNKPPQILLRAISQLQSNDLVGETSFTRHLSHAFRTGQAANSIFARPDKDWLFQPHYTHQSANARADCATTCDPCQRVERVARDTHDPYIHYGLIASGNRVMKHAETRDRLAREMGILCFEMEAAGLVDQLAFLTIRGICDYCDSHKNKQWQGYAALTAAAYAKSLLSAVPVTIYGERELSKTQRVQFLFLHIKSVEKNHISQLDLLSIIQWNQKEVARLWSVCDPNGVHTPQGWLFEGTTALHTLIIMGSKSAFDEILKKRDNGLDVRDNNGNTPLMLAIKHGQKEIAMTLLKQSLEWQLHHKSGNGSLNVEKEKKCHFVGVNMENNDGDTALSLAIEENSLEIILELIDAGADNDVHIDSDRRPLSWASENGHEEVVKLLLDHGAKSDTLDSSGRTPLSWASEHGHEVV
ncbi:nucleoside phosphorylase domain-containing protein, partial [Aspergillus granulosus]